MAEPFTVALLIIFLLSPIFLAPLVHHANRHNKLTLGFSTRFMRDLPAPVRLALEAATREVVKVAPDKDSILQNATVYSFGFALPLCLIATCLLARPSALRCVLAISTILALALDVGPCFDIPVTPPLISASEFWSFQAKHACRTFVDEPVPTWCLPDAEISGLIQIGSITGLFFAIWILGWGARRLPIVLRRVGGCCARYLTPAVDWSARRLAVALRALWYPVAGFIPSRSRVRGGEEHLGAVQEVLANARPPSPTSSTEAEADEEHAPDHPFVCPAVPPPSPATSESARASNPNTPPRARTVIGLESYRAPAYASPSPPHSPLPSRAIITAMRRFSFERAAAHRLDHALALGTGDTTLLARPDTNTATQRNKKGGRSGERARIARVGETSGSLSEAGF
ncbi:hypothetical protein B0H16DRAFT_314847 [Mycena metata]|uniref:Uncharacterized protein n=1 Tax=Mycena metata TaxID=1033252 RepID=A0AAD7NMU2_9AGAR|nr:hypothetical protein B0H16DRAFT_314847 [Mycena metata]